MTREINPVDKGPPLIAEASAYWTYAQSKLLEVLLTLISSLRKLSYVDEGFHIKVCKWASGYTSRKWTKGSTLQSASIH